MYFCSQCNYKFEELCGKCPRCGGPVLPEEDGVKEQKESAFVRELEHQEITDQFTDGWSA